MPPKKTFTTRTLLATLATLAVFFVGLYALAFERILSTMREVAALSAMIGEETRRERVFQTAEKVVEQSAAARAEIERRFLREKDTVSFVERIEELGNSLMLAPEFSLIQKVGHSSGKKALQISLKTTGSFENTAHFLSLVEAFPYAIIFEHVFMEKEKDIESGSAEPSNLWKGVFIFNVASYLEEKQGS